MDTLFTQLSLVPYFNLLLFLFLMHWTLIPNLPSRRQAWATKLLASLLRNYVGKGGWGGSCWRECLCVLIAQCLVIRLCIILRWLLCFSCSITNTAPLVHSSASFLCFPQNLGLQCLSVCQQRNASRVKFSRQSLLKVFVANLEHWNERTLQGKVSGTPAAWVGSCSMQRKYIPGHSRPVTDCWKLTDQRV